MNLLTVAPKTVAMRPMTKMSAHECPFLMINDRGWVDAVATRRIVRSEVIMCWLNGGIPYGRRTTGSGIGSAYLCEDCRGEDRYWFLPIPIYLSMSIRSTLEAAHLSAIAGTQVVLLTKGKDSIKAVNQHVRGNRSKDKREAKMVSRPS